MSKHTCSCCGKKLTHRRKTGMCRICYDESKVGEKNPNWKGGMASQSCKQCGVEFEVFPCQATNDTRVFCSIECRAAWQSKHRRGENSSGWRGGNVTLVCEQCGKEFNVSPYREDEAKFCSLSCKGKWQSENLLGENHPHWQGGKVTLLCIVCGKEFRVKPYAARGERGKFCSFACMGKWRSENSTGEDNPNWRGGLSFEPYTTDWTPALRRYIRKRDNHTCAICGKRARSVHHINYLKNDCRGENLITLCRKCHGKTNVRRRFWTAILAPVAQRREAA